MRRWAASTSLLVAAAVSACFGNGAAPSADVAAVIETTEVHYAEFEDYLSEQVGADAGGLDSRALSRLFDDFVDQRLVLRWTRDQGLVGPGASRWEAVASVLEAAARSPVAESEVRRRYEESADSFTLPERVHLRHLLVAELATAEAAREAVVSGERSFGEVAESVSLDPSAAVGGDQGEIATEDLPEPFAGVVSGLEPGEVSRVVEAADGFHLFLVEERLPARRPRFEEVEQVLRERIRAARADARLADVVDRARARYNVRVYEENLPFDYLPDDLPRPRPVDPSGDGGGGRSDRPEGE